MCDDNKTTNGWKSRLISQMPGADDVHDDEKQGTLVRTTSLQSSTSVRSTSIHLDYSWVKC